MPGSFFVLERHVGSYTSQNVSAMIAQCFSTFFASFLAFFCFAAEAFSILCRNRTGTRFDFGSETIVSTILRPNGVGNLTSDLHIGLLAWCVLSQPSMEKFEAIQKKFGT
jgi:hypothetical protein